MPYWTASFTTPTASSSKATACVVGLAKRPRREQLPPDRPAGPQAPPTRAAASLVGHSASRAGPSCGPPRRSPPLSSGLTGRQFPAHINPSVVFASARDHHRLESVITIVWNR